MPLYDEFLRYNSVFLGFEEETLPIPMRFTDECVDALLTQAHKLSISMFLLSRRLIRGNLGLTYRSKAGSGCGRCCRPCSLLRALVRHAPISRLRADSPAATARSTIPSALPSTKKPTSSCASLATIAFKSSGNPHSSFTHAYSNPRLPRAPLTSTTRYADGFFLRTIGSFGSGEGQMFQPWVSAVVGDGNIVVVEYGNHRVQVLRCGCSLPRICLLWPTVSIRYRDGAHQRTFGRRGSGRGEFIHPTGASPCPFRALCFIPRSTVEQALPWTATGETSLYSTAETVDCRS